MNFITTLMIALVEEFGHHLDYLLRFEYSLQKETPQEMKEQNLLQN